jgi:hypothetical protein
MNYKDWVKTFENRTPEHLAAIVNAIDTLEKDVDIRREFDDLGLFAGFSIRNAAKEVLKNKEEEFNKTVAQRVYTMAIARIAEEYPQVNPGVITCSVTFNKVLEWIKTNDEILDTAGAIIDTVIDDAHLHYPDLKSKFIKEADLEPGADESECSILYGDSYYSLEDSIVEVLTIAFEKKDLALTYDNQTQTTSYFWDCECKDKFIHPKDQKVCFDCNMVAADQPDSRVAEVVSAKLKGEI